MRAVPTLEAIALRRGGIPNVLLAAGAGSAAILSEHGHQLDAIRFPVRPCTQSFLFVACPCVACPMLWTARPGSASILSKHGHRLDSICLSAKNIATCYVWGAGRPYVI